MGQGSVVVTRGWAQVHSRDRERARHARLPRPSHVLDRLLLLEILALLFWSSMIAATSGGDPWPVLATTAIAAACYLGGRALHDHARTREWALTGAAVVAAFALFVPGALSGRPLSPPLGYSNANAALYSVACGFAVVAAVRSRGGAVPVAGLVALVLVAATAESHSLVGLAVAALVFASAIVAAATGRSAPWWFGLVGASTVVCAVAATVALGLSSPVGTEGLVGDHVTRRAELWHDAGSIAARHPLTGVGARRFPIVSATARADNDTTAAHSAFLELAAEEGFPAGAALLLLVTTATLRVSCGGRPSRLSWIGVTAATGLSVQAAVDYTLDFPAVVAAGSLLIGVCTSGGQEAWSPPLARRRGDG